MLNRQNLSWLNSRDFFIILILILGFFVVPAKPLLADEGEYEELEPVVIEQNTNLTGDINGSVVIQANNLTLDCQGHKIIGSGSGSGVYLEGKYQIIIKNCLIENFDTGIDLWCSHQNQIFENTVADNGLGININCSCAASDNLVYHNNFKNNNKQATLISGDNDLFDNGWPGGGNYWSDYAGSDTNGDGIGDASYTFLNDGEDRYPFIKENGWKEEAPEWRKSILAGDILYDPFASGVGHIGLYVGDNEVVEAIGYPPWQSGYPGKVEENQIADWDYPQRNTVYLLRVKKPGDLNNTEWNQKILNAIDFAKRQQSPTAKLYDWHWYQKQSDIDSPSWYCSELVWAAYYNQDVDLEYRANGVAFDLIDPVSPVEIFDDEDTDTISSHLEGFNSTPWYRQFAPLLVLSPVNVVITDKNGNTIDQSGVNIPGATFIENQTDASGHKYSIIYLPVEYGPYQIKVTRKPDATDEDIYSLKTQTESGDIWLTQNHPVPAENENDEYNFDPAALNDDPAASGFNDTEESSGNTYQAGTLDFSLTSSGNFSPNITPTQNSLRTISITNNGTLGFQYTASTTNASGSLCDYLNLTANLDGGANEYTGTLTGFNYNAGQFSAPEDWVFTVTLTSSDPGLQNKTCIFDFVFNGVQIGGTGFGDQEIISNTVTSGQWVAPPPTNLKINEVYYHVKPPNENEPENEWVEIYNPTSSAVNISGWKITDNSGTERTFCVSPSICSSTSIPAYGFAVVTRDASTWEYWPGIPSDAVKIVLGKSIGNGLANTGTGDRVILKNADGVEIDAVSWLGDDYAFGLGNGVTPATGAGHSIARKIKGVDTDSPDDWEKLINPNPGTNPHTVVMNEIMFNPSGENKEWAELYNISDKDIDVSGWYFENNRGDKTVISEENSDNNGNLGDEGEIEVPSGGRLVVYFEKEYFGNEKDEVSLYNGMGTPDDEKDDVREDVYNYENADVFPEDKTFSRIPDGTGIWIDPEATPGKENKLSEKETDAFRLLTFEKCFDDEGNLNKNNQAEICAPAFLEYLGMIDDLDDKKINGSTELKVLKLKKEEEEKKLADLLKETEEMIAGQKNAIEPGSAEEAIPQNGLNQEAETGTEKEKTVLEEETKENDKVEKEEKPVEVKVKVSGKLDLAGGLKIKDQDLKIKEVEILGWKKDKAKIKINLDKLDKVKKAGKVKVKIKDLDLPGKAEVISHKKDKVVLEIEVVEVKADKKTEEKVEDKTDIKAIKKIEVIDNSLKKENEE